MLQQEKESRRKVMPVLDEQEKEDIGQKLAMSLKLGREITIRIFGEFEDRTLTGTVIQMDQQTRQARISIGIDDWERVPFSVILGAED
ncbi:YolD-like family protein (plasmid) [Paenibacillus peoriae]|uniref:YolD-like family protein n=2 Tax=Paenibacillus peoriae TaxID=59893 RepID=A0A7H0YHJ2_9BACL|nr:YolD-like family protein [Paenibacillus peoriae]